MLSRIAESLYWIGRYVERADDTARILDVYVHHLLEDPSVDADAACRALLAVLGITPPDGQPPGRAAARPTCVAFDAGQRRLDRRSLDRQRAGERPRSRGRSSRARCGSASTPRGNALPSASGPPSGSGPHGSSASSRSGPRCSPGSPTRR